MAKFSIVGPGYNGRSSNINASRCVNFYPELNSQDSKSQASLVGTPGTLLYVDTQLGAIRGAHFFNNLIYFVSGNKLYSVDAAKNIMPIIDSVSGNQVELATVEGRVSMADNGIYSVSGGSANQLAFVDGQNVYVVNVTTNVFTSFAVPAKSITFIGGYFMIDKGGAQFAISNLYDGTTWPALAFSTADTYPDDLMTVVNNHNEAWLIGQYSAEIWAADGSSNPMPFSKVTVIDFGTEAPYSVAKGNNTLFWLATQRNGNSGERFGIGMINGYGMEIVSPQPINLHISKYSIVSDAWGYCYTDNGHEFYVLTFPSENATWVYDATTGQCHERSYYSDDPYKVNRHIGNAYVHAWGKHYIGSYIDGKIYEMSEDYYTDNGTPIASVRIAPPIDGEEGRIFISKLQLDAEMGVGDIIYQQYRISTFGDSGSVTYVLTLGGITLFSHTLAPSDTTFYNVLPLLIMRAINQSFEGIPDEIMDVWENTWAIADRTNNTVTLALGMVSFTNHNLPVKATLDPADGLYNPAWEAAYPGVPIPPTLSYPWVVVTSLVQGEDTMDLAYTSIPSYQVEGMTQDAAIRVDPKAILSWSDDGGHTWSNNHIRSLGKLGDYKRRAIWRRQGSTRNRCYRVAVTDAIKKVLIGSYMEFKKGRG